MHYNGHVSTAVGESKQKAEVSVRCTAHHWRPLITIINTALYLANPTIIKPNSQHTPPALSQHRISATHTTRTASLPLTPPAPHPCHSHHHHRIPATHTTITASLPLTHHHRIPATHQLAYRTDRVVLDLPTERKGTISTLMIDKVIRGVIAVEDVVGAGA
jgi:hypothetical protein